VISISTSSIFSLYVVLHHYSNHSLQRDRIGGRAVGMLAVRCEKGPERGDVASRSCTMRR
jgi:hypothetical protein